MNFFSVLGDSDNEEETPKVVPAKKGAAAAPAKKDGAAPAKKDAAPAAKKDAAPKTGAKTADSKAKGMLV
jgi:hypothetical protein